MSSINKRVAAIALAAAAIGTGVFATAQAGVTTVKTYTASTTTPSLTLSGTQSANITLTNTSSNGIAFKAANLSIPAGLSVTSAGTSSTAGHVEIEDGKVELRDVNIGNVAPNNKVTVTIALKAAPASCGNFLWKSDVRQSNEFNGTNNKLTLVGNDVTMKTPCNSATVTCTTGDAQNCSTGTIQSVNGTTASVNANAKVNATLSASLTDGTTAFQCTASGYTATSDLLTFNIISSTTSAVAKTVTFSAPLPVGDTRVGSDFQVCFKAPYAFNALLPSQLLQDVTNVDFSNNTEVDGGENKGLLLSCGLGFGAPCVLNRAVAPGLVTITLSVPPADPAVRF